jgi:hypothetical protein
MIRLRLLTSALVIALPTLAEAASAQAGCDQGARVLAGQTQRDQRYTQCALRVDQKRIMRGQSGEVLLRLGPYTSVTNRVEWLSDSARVHAERYGVRRSTAANLRLLAWGMTITSVVLGAQVYRNYHRQADRIQAQQDAGGPVTERLELEKSKLAVGSALSIGAFGVGWIAGRVNEDARAELSRAIWWHNRELR